MAETLPACYGGRHTPCFGMAETPLAARTLNKLTARAVATLTKPGRYADGGGLYLVAERNGSLRWGFFWTREGKSREMTLGPAREVTLARAREKAAECRRQLADGLDPKATRDAAKAAARPVPTFGEVADDLIASKSPEWKNTKHRRQWSQTLADYAAPLRSMPVDQIATDDVIRVLKPIWLTKPETASRLRGRIERVLTAAKVRGIRTGENPAAWKGHLDQLLTRPRKLSRGHHAALQYKGVSAFVGRLRERQAASVAAYALEFAILTAGRSGEVLGARWDEMDLDAKVWTVPAARMKGGREHRVPLAPRALEILKAMALGRMNTFVFIGQKRDSPLSSMALEMCLRRMAVSVTPHGFRSSFRDWAGNETEFAREVAEAALAHAVGDATEMAYRRGDALEKRRLLMTAWAAYCEPPAAALEAAA